jgi:putative endonuclease
MSLRGDPLKRGDEAICRQVVEYHNWEEIKKHSYISHRRYITPNRLLRRFSAPRNDYISRGFMGKQYYIYIITNKNNTVLYTGVTNNLVKRIFEHRNKLADGFSKRYNLEKLVYYEIYDDPYNAICREKQIKGGSRKKKVQLISDFNPDWIDLYDSL